MKQVLVPVFPGTNCERETATWVSRNLMVEATYHHAANSAPDLQNLAAVIIPGGFSHGDYLRAGALAARSPQMQFVRRAAAAGVPVLGICNGFQILCESGLLPGVLLPNSARHHLHGPVPLVSAVEAWQGSECAWMPALSALQALHTATGQAAVRADIPISCGMGRYFPGLPVAGSATAPSLGSGARPLFRYADASHPLVKGVGSFDLIAGIVSADGLVAGMMPHPERASDKIVGGEHGLLLLAGLAQRRGLGVRAASPLEEFGHRHGLFA